MTEISWEPDETGSLAPVTYDEDGNKVYPAWAPLPGSQTAFLNCPVFEVLYTGSRGPGKMQPVPVK